MAACVLLTPRELAERSGWPERRIRSLIAARQLRHLKIGAAFYLPESAVQEFIDQNMVEPAGAQGVGEDPKAKL
ncbi:MULTISPECIES: helix-turn-helix domain-containing protein [Roseobacteraceae]|uniref:helix-turn-helix domain-containing protein n=1 Tax=Roseobacteraceae TaxID=2854170 RepID=UPI003A94BE36